MLTNIAANVAMAFFLIYQNKKIARKYKDVSVFTRFFLLLSNVDYICFV